MEMHVDILIIEHSHGTDVYPCRNEVIARQMLYTYVKDNWNSWLPDVPMPDNLDKMVYMYFDTAQTQEWYLLDTYPIIGSEYIE